MNQVQNSVTLIGNLGNAPEMINTKSDSAMVKFSIATNESYTKNGEKIKSTQWHRCITFGKRGETLHKYAKKGSKIAVQGKIMYRNYTDKDGNARTSTNIEVSDFTFLDKKASQTAG